MTDLPTFYVLNRDPGDTVEVLHANPRETCNVDDAQGKQEVDAETADALLQLGSARKCEHCWR